MTLAFSQNLFETTYDQITSEVLKLSLTAFDEEMQSYMGFTWETIEYSDKTVYLQLTFENAMYISVGSQFDLLTIEVLNERKFRSRENYLTIAANTTLTAGIPR